MGAAPKQVIVIGGSAGSIESLQLICADLTGMETAPILIVVHVPPHARSMLPEILSRASGLPAMHVQTAVPPLAGAIYIAPPDQHIALDGTLVCPLRGPRVNRNRPAIDPLFVSAARAYGPGVVGVLLSGYLDDGVAGLAAIRNAGGVVIVQDPSTTAHPDMPQNAIQRVAVDHVLPPHRIGSAIMAIIGSNANGISASAGAISLSVEALTTEAADPEPQPAIDLAAMSCPDCGGVLQAMNGPEPTRFRCRVGHAYSIDSLITAKSEEIEEALWTAVRALEEKAEMSLSLAERLARRGADSVMRRHLDTAAAIQRDADMVRKLIEAGSHAERGTESD